MHSGNSTTHADIVEMNLIRRNVLLPTNKKLSNIQSVFDSVVISEKNKYIGLH